MDYLKDTDPFDHQIFDCEEIISIISGMFSVLGVLFSLKLDWRAGHGPGLTIGLSSSASVQNVWLSTQGENGWSPPKSRNAGSGLGATRRGPPLAGRPPFDSLRICAPGLDLQPKASRPARAPVTIRIGGAHFPLASHAAARAVRKMRAAPQRVGARSAVDPIS